MRRLAMILAAAGLILGAGRVSVATVVVESISGSPGDWTYTYTLTNGGSGEIWTWAVWFPSNPNATSVTTDSNWSTTLSTKGYFPQQFINEVGSVDYVYDSTADPFHAGTANPLVGPNGEPGFYALYANDYMTANAGEYWDGDSWELLPDIEPGGADPLWDEFWRGSKYGYDLGWTEGALGNVYTSYGVGNGSTSQLIVQTSSLIPGSKSFSFNTTDYYYSINDWANSSIYTDFEGSGTVIPEPLSIIIWSLLSLVCVGAYRWRRRSGSVEFGGSRRPSRQPARRPWSEGTTEAILEIIERGRMDNGSDLR